MPPTRAPKPTFFRTPADFGAWLARNHDTATELLVGFYKRDSGRPSITWPESVDEALCVGWIDGVRRRIDDISYSIRFTPRRPTSTWSAINIKRVAELTRQGRMRPNGLRAFEKRRENKSGIYAYEQRSAELPAEFASVFKRNKRAWAFFGKQAAWYRKTCMWYVVSAKRDETRTKRLALLIDCSARGVTLPGLTRTK